MRDDELPEVQSKFARRRRTVLLLQVLGVATIGAWFGLGAWEPDSTVGHLAVGSALVAWIAVILLNSRCPACGTLSQDFVTWWFCPECGVPLRRPPT